ncbi:PD-(D/E)XK motif protein [Leisingera thetidis]|uniref:PD-(D/E)XK motif protein n=1 Tax=Leisingera thetidis TaxID=2930199 RepID=UPI0021F7F56B|nr:PD-(D/E)XK motif protein [Leisingera thetidis]
MPNTPEAWAGLAPGGIDSRRVDSAGRWGFWWTVTVDGCLALALRATALPERRPEPPRLKAIELRYSESVIPAIILILKDRAQAALFETLCRDIISATRDATDEGQAVTRFVARCARWHHLLRGGGPGMSEERQKGLIGELCLLKELARAIGPSAALIAWGGPLGAQKDFDDGQFCIEVKTTRSAGKPKVRIASEHQLSDVPDRDFVLAALAVDRVAAPEGADLHTWVKQTAASLKIEEHGRQNDWDHALAASGYCEEDETLRAFTWKAGMLRYYDVVGGFPRLLPPLPRGISDLTYSVDLSTCQSFERDAPFTPPE